VRKKEVIFQFHFHSMLSVHSKQNFNLE